MRWTKARNWQKRPRHRNICWRKRKARKRTSETLSNASDSSIEYFEKTLYHLQIAQTIDESIDARELINKPKVKAFHKTGNKDKEENGISACSHSLHLVVESTYHKVLRKSRLLSVSNPQEPPCHRILVLRKIFLKSDSTKWQWSRQTTGPIES